MQFTRLASVLAAIFLTLPAHGAPLKLKVSSTSFKNKETIPASFVCEDNGGQARSPQLSWTKGPSATKSYALVVTDPDAPGGTFTHWGVYDISLSKTTASENKKPSGKETINDFGDKGYTDVCPPEGTHRYTFTVYALSKKLSPRSDNTAAGLAYSLQRELKKFVVGKGQLTGLVAATEEDGGGVSGDAGACLDKGGTWSCITDGQGHETCSCK